jgi:hypothetical protein
MMVHYFFDEFFRISAIITGVIVGFLVYASDMAYQVGTEEHNLPLYIILIFLVVVKGLEINMAMANAVIMRDALKGIEAILEENKRNVEAIKNASTNK